MNARRKSRENYSNLESLVSFVSNRSKILVSTRTAWWALWHIYRRAIRILSHSPVGRPTSSVASRCPASFTSCRPVSSISSCASSWINRKFSDIYWKPQTTSGLFHRRARVTASLRAEERKQLGGRVSARQRWRPPPTIHPRSSWCYFYVL